ncbi:maltokinase [Streptomyces sp. NPDC091272]|uniref:maltokinase N-terminal cap-like domain-containing protein n=1 Tax=Streptomyces sp. NPDC091272 TaxID=3365981 RepID=UPI00381E8AC5
MTPTGLSIPFDSLERALAAWLPGQRWYTAKGRPLRSASIEQLSRFTEDTGPTPAQGLILVTRTAFDDDGADEFYQVPVGVRPATAPLPGPALIAVLDDVVVYEALGDQYLVRDLLSLVARDADRAALTFRSEPAGRGDWPPAAPALSSRPLGVDQSNTSVVVDDRYLLKVYRRLHTGTNPDLELLRALHDGDPDTPAPPLHGAVEGQLRGAPVTYAVLQRYLPDAEDGWSAALRRLDGEAPAWDGFAADAHEMGRATAAVHLGLAAAFGTERLDAAGPAALAARLVTGLQEALHAVPALRRHEDAVRRLYAEVAALPPGVAVQRVHGDLHLGQVLRSGAGWLLTDFEGEPSKPMAERRAVRPAVSDVASMFRSFDYAAHCGAGGRPGVPQALRLRWTTAAQDSFCAGYARTAGTDPRDEPVLLRAYTLCKALYEAVYETRCRPHLARVPLAAVARLVAPPPPDPPRSTRLPRSSPDVPDRQRLVRLPLPLLRDDQQGDR